MREKPAANAVDARRLVVGCWSRADAAVTATAGLRVSGSWCRLGTVCPSDGGGGVGSCASVFFTSGRGALMRDDDDASLCSGIGVGVEQQDVCPNSPGILDGGEPACRVPVT